MWKIPLVGSLRKAIQQSVGKRLLFRLFFQPTQ
nr:MAG TPA: hypothetical protein [Caudoviricetes sp.]